MLENITPLILTYNEAPNIRRTLEQLRWARDVVIVDSFSDDETLEIVSRYPQARIVQRMFDTHEKQWNFALKETAISSDWVLALDADYVLTAEFLDELKALQNTSDVKGYQATFTYCIHGKPLRSGIYPPVTLLFRPGFASYMQDGHTHKVALSGKIGNLNAPILHDDRKPLSRWFHAQSRYTQLEADKILISDPKHLSWTDRVRRWRIVAPPAVVLYCLVIRGGVLDGWAGFYYAFQRGLAELMLSLHLLDHDLRGLGKRSTQSPREPKGVIEKETPNPQPPIGSAGNARH